MLSAFPHLTTGEFAQACSDLRQRFHQHGSQGEWQSVEVVHSLDMAYMRIVKELREDAEDETRVHVDTEENEIEENDDEVLDTTQKIPALIHYDVVLSPVYQVPVLYFSISDPQHRYPPNMATLYEHLIPPQFKAQAENPGVMGGITINDHPATNRPVFFIHPCQTTEVMGASVGHKAITAEEYLLMWIGALGQCVGLNVPLSLMKQNIRETANA